MPLVGYLRAHVTHIANLLCDERAIGEVLLVRRTMRVNGEGHSLLAYGELETLPRLQAGIGIQHLDFAFVAQVYLRLVTYDGCQVASKAHTSRADLKPAFALTGLVFIFTPQRAMQLRCPVYFVRFLRLGLIAKAQE